MSNQFKNPLISHSMPSVKDTADDKQAEVPISAVSYTHLTLPTNREV